MQPSSPQRPVMDISAPRLPATPPLPRPQIAPVPSQAVPVSPNPSSVPAANSPRPVSGAMAPGASLVPQAEAKKDAAPALPVHEPPQSQGQSENSETTPSRQDSSTETKANEDAPVSEEQFTPTPTTNPHPAPPLPVGAIVGAIFVMTVLAAAAILVYVQTQ